MSGYSQENDNREDAATSAKMSVAAIAEETISMQVRFDFFFIL